MQVKLRAISKRAKDRINSHGDIFELLQQNEAIPGEKNDLILVESLNNTWRGQKWLGWLEINKDVEIIAAFHKAENK